VLMHPILGCLLKYFISFPSMIIPPFLEMLSGPFHKYDAFQKSR
jgi:hypothetical protein